MLFIFVLTGTAFVPFFAKEFTISLLKSIKTFSTIDITFSSVTLSPLINLVFIFSFFSSLSILGPPPCTIIIDKPNLFSKLMSSIKLLKISLSIKTLPPYFTTISSFLYFLIYLGTFLISGASAGQIFLFPLNYFSQTFSLSLSLFFS